MRNKPNKIYDVETSTIESESRFVLRNTNTEVNNIDPSHLLSQIDVIKNVDHQKCIDNDNSKKSPYKLKTENLNHIKPSLGNTIVDNLSNNTLSHKLHLLALARKIQLFGKKMGLMGHPESPMQSQVFLHSTLTVLVLDQPSYEQYYQVSSSIKNNSSQFTKILNSKEFKDMDLVLDNWKFCADGNLGFQLNCNPAQNHKMSLSDFKQMFFEKDVKISNEQKNTLYNTLLSTPGIYNPQNSDINLTRLQFIRFKFALAGAQIKAFHPGTLMVIAWTKDAKQLKSHDNLHQFTSKLNELVSKQIGLVFKPDSVNEYAYKERTLHPSLTVSADRKGSFSKNLSSSNLVLGK